MGLAGICVKEQVKKIYLFNPQNDLALASGGINYVAPPFAMQMARDLAVLPAYIAEPDSLLVSDSDLDAEWLEKLNTDFGLDIHAIKRSELRSHPDACIMPWGWSLDLRRRLIKWGFPSTALPSKDQIEHLRGLSHRRISILFNKRLSELAGSDYCPSPVELAVPTDIVKFANQHKNCFIKTPWSSSGRGIYHTTKGSSPEFEQWCKGLLKRQGSLLCEKALNKVMDFAVEFHVNNGNAQARGLSVFTTDAHSQYEHGLVASTDMLTEKITALYPELQKVVQQVTQVVNEIVAPHYNGWFGIDMLLFNALSSNNAKCSSLPSIGINPCVELNLRPTMGAITSILGDTLLENGKTAHFRIEQRSSISESWPEHEPPTIKNRHLTSGTMCLTPPSPSALYRATLSCV